MLHRRNFLLSAISSIVFAGYSHTSLSRETPRGRIAVIMLEGGMDGLAAVPPLGDPDLQPLRNSLISSSPIQINPFFGLHPELGGFGGLLKNGEASIVHATSFPYVKRSHFEGQNVMQTGNLIPFSSKSGWLGRALEHSGLLGRSMSLDLPLLVRGETELDNYYPADIRGSIEPDPKLINLLMDHYDPIIANSFSNVEKKYQVTRNITARDPVSLATYAGAQMDLEDGPAAAVVTITDFDTHADQGADNKQHHDQLAVVDDVFLGFKRGLRTKWKDTIILTLTEFGRTVKPNGSKGTDHGYGSVGLLAGGRLNGGKIIVQWPGLSKKDLFENRDLQSTIDYRSVCAACIEEAYGLDHGLISSKIFYSSNLMRIHDLLFK